MLAPHDRAIRQTEHMQITYNDGTVTGSAAGEPGEVGVLLAHGAGAGQDHPWIITVREGLARRGLFAMSFNYRYTEAGKRAPDRMSILLEVHPAAADVLAAECDRVVRAGKSMGGRVGSHLAGDEGWPASGLVYFGYPLVPVGKSDPRPTGHLNRIAAPQLFIAGSRDRLSPPTLMEPIAASITNGTFQVVDDGDHSFKVPKRSPRSSEEVLDDVTGAAAEWIITRT